MTNHALSSEHDQRLLSPAKDVLSRAPFKTTARLRDRGGLGPASELPRSSPAKAANGQIVLLTSAVSPAVAAPSQMVYKRAAKEAS